MASLFFRLFSKSGSSRGLGRPRIWLVKLSFTPSAGTRLCHLGLTLVEILIAGAIASIIFAIISRVILTQMSTSRRIEAGQRYREMSNRINYLVAVEGSESSDVLFGSAAGSVPNNCEASRPVSSILMRLDIPKPTGVYGDVNNTSSVYYYNSLSGDLVRCGPLSEVNGVLDHDLALTSSAPVASVVSRSTSMKILQAGESCNGESSTDRQIAYRLTFTGASYVPPCAVARAKTIFVCNPPLPQAAVSFVGSISGTTLQISSLNTGSGPLNIGLVISASGVQSGTVIVDFGTGLGGSGGQAIGSYIVSPSQNVGSRTMSASAQVGDCT